MASASDKTASVSYPLDAFYSGTGAAVPKLTMIEGQQMPQPYRSLLVHDDDMTPTLEKHHQCRLTLKVLAKCEMDDSLFREVLLVDEETGKPAVFGAIRIHLDHFDDEARQLILECRRPLGGILGQLEIPHRSKPTAFFSVKPDKTIQVEFAVDGSNILYGRHNELFDDQGRVLAQVVEVLPPE